MDVPDPRRRERVQAWSTPVPGIAEVLHARFVDHVYPAHTHDTWTLLIVEQGAIRYDLERAEHGTLDRVVTLLPPHVPHTGRAAVQNGFRKRVLYLDSTVLDESLVGASVDRPTMRDPLLHRRVLSLHAALTGTQETLEAESRLALIRARLQGHLGGTPTRAVAEPGRLAGELRDLLDASVATSLTLRQAAALLHAHPDALVRSFQAAFGLPPHRYLIGRRIDLARRLLLAGQPVAQVALASGFADQSHLTRHFARQIGTTPARYARNVHGAVETGRAAPSPG